MITQPYRRQCGLCLGPIAVIEIQNGEKSIAICPKCSSRPDLADVISRMPTLAFLEHQSTCSTCSKPDQPPCAKGVEALAQYPGYWSEVAAAKGGK